MDESLARSRVLDTRETAAFLSVSVSQLRRLYRGGKVPKPLRISARKYGWRTSDLVDLVDRRAAEAQAAA